MAYAAILFSIFGNDIFKFLRKSLKKWNFLLRLAVFVAVCAFGIGAVTSLCGRLLKNFLSQAGDFFLIGTIIILFILAGIVAEHRKQV